MSAEPIEEIGENGYEAAIKNQIEELKNRLQNPVIPSEDAGNFERHGLLCKGGFGRVLKVSRGSEETFYAMKQICKREMENKVVYKNIKQERDILVAVKFHFIVKLLWCCKDDFSLYFIFELANCGDLLDFMDHQTLAESQVWFYIAQIVIAVEYLHGGSIMHRDIKPDNILVCSDGYIKVTDFNLSKHLRDGIRTHTACGTPGYIAPEVQIQIRAGYTFSVDFYSVGAVTKKIIYKNLEKRNTASAASGVREEVSETSEQFIRVMTLTDPNKRLGANGAQEVRRHPFFGTTNWDNLYMKRVIPPVESPTPVAIKRGDVSDDARKANTEPFKHDYKSFC